MSAGETASDALVSALADVDVVFGNLGSDHAGIIEALARARERGERRPAVVLAPHEASAIAAAHGYAMASGRAQAVLVHVDVGTANLGGGVHNAARGQAPVLIIAGLTPFTLEGELPGTRNGYPNHLQEVRDQSSLVRPYVKWEYDLRTGTNVRQVVARALQIARSAPHGPVYLTGAREVLAAAGGGRTLDPTLWQPIEPIPAPTHVVTELLAAMADAQFPVIMTSGYGRDPQSVADLVRLAESMGVGVVQPVPAAMGFPADHELHLGYNAAPILDRADLVLVVDSDAPWMPAVARPGPETSVYLIDTDPLKEGMPLWYLESRRFVRADPPTAIRQLADAGDRLQDRGDVGGRRRALGQVHRDQRERWAGEREDGLLTVPVVAAAIDAAIGPDAVLVNEATSNAETVFRHLPRTRPGTLFASGGSSLGWFGGAAVGIGLARPTALVVAVVGDGTFFMASPASAYWMSQRYHAPFLTVILDNGGWNATKQNVIRQYAGGVADISGRSWTDLGQSADLAGVAAAAGGAVAFTVTERTSLEDALQAGVAAVQSGRSAVVRVVLNRISDEGIDEPSPR